MADEDDENADKSQDNINEDDDNYDVNEDDNNDDDVIENDNHDVIIEDDNNKKRKLESSDNDDNDPTKDRHIKKLPKSWRDGDWLCPNPDCGDHQYAYKQICSSCKTVKPNDEKDGSGKKVRKLPPSWREGDWFCPGCGNHKYAFKLYCECGQPKPMEIVRRNDFDRGQRGGYDNGPRGGFNNGQRGGYDNGPRGGFDNGPRGGFDNGSRGFDNGPRGYDNGPRGGFDNSLRGTFENSSVPKTYGRGAGKPGDWRCPNSSCANNLGDFCFGSRPFCKKCGAARPEGGAVDNFIGMPGVPHAVIPAGPSQNVITLVDRALLLSAKIPTFDVRYTVDNGAIGGLFNLTPMNMSQVNQLIYPVYEALHGAFLENPSYLLAQLESKANPFKNDLAGLATRRLYWDSKMSSLAVSVSKVAQNSRERFLHGERLKEIAHLTPYPICPEITKQQGRRWPDFYRGHTDTSTSILAYKMSETRAVIALHILPSIAELDPIDMYYFQLPLAYLTTA